MQKRKRDNIYFETKSELIKKVQYKNKNLRN